MDKGTKFVITDAARLESRLSHYFRTSKLRSFIRQLYLYHFKCDTSGPVKKYHNPKFKRNAYHKLIGIKQVQGNTRKEKARDLAIEYELLCEKYKSLSASVFDFRSKVCDVVSKNAEISTSIFTFKFGFAERVKALILNFVLTVVFANNKAATKELQLLSQCGLVSRHNLNHFFANEKAIENLPEQISQFIENNLLTSNMQDEQLNKLLTISLQSLNKNYFCLRNEEFVPLVLRHVLHDDHNLRLTQHESYKHLAARKEVYDVVCEAVFKYFGRFYDDLFAKKSFEGEKFDVFRIKDNLPVEYDDSDNSVRSFGNSLNFSTMDEISRFRPDFDE